MSSYHDADVTITLHCLGGFWLCAILSAWLPNIFIKYFINILMFKVAVIAGNLELAEVIQSHKDDDVGKLQQNSEPMIKFKASACVD